jgi:TRAP-type mannitol/chloroaromatic compound transport system permease small subunit
MGERVKTVNVLKLISRAIDNIIDKIGVVLSFGALVILAVITFEVFSRRFFNSPTIWAYETITMVFAAYVVLICAYGLQKGSFVCVDLFSAKFPPITGNIITLVTYGIFFFPFVGGIMKTSWDFFYKSITTNELSWSQWSPIVWPVKLALFIGLLMLLAQGISEIIKAVVQIQEELRDRKKGLNELEKA